MSEARFNFEGTNTRREYGDGSLKGRDFLSLADFTSREIELMLSAAAEIKARHRRGEPFAPLKGKTIGMIFAKPSTRTRVSFEVAAYQLGGHALNLSASELQLGRGETVADTGRVLSRYLDAIMIRTFSHDQVIELAEAATVPVINGLTDLLHPCQALADLLTVKELKGRLAGLKLAYVGDGNNVAHSLLYGCAQVGVNIAVATPQGYEPSAVIVDRARAMAARSGSIVELTSDPREAAAGAEVIYTDVWTSMGQEAEQEERRRRLAPYQVNARLVGEAAAGSVVMHCLPAHRGEEITDEVIDGPRSVVFHQAENRLHAQKAVLALLM